MTLAIRMRGKKKKKRKKVGGSRTADVRCL